MADTHNKPVDPYNAGYDQPAAPLGVNVNPYAPPIGMEQPTPVVANAVIVQQSQTYTLHIVLSCIVFWFCGWLCGAIAFFLAYSAKDKSEQGDAQGARSYGRASIIVSCVGIVVGIAVIIYISTTMNF